MSRIRRQSYNLPPLQKLIVETLTKIGPQTINETGKKISRHYTATNRAFHALEAKGLIKSVALKEYRNRKFDRFWLTYEGIIVAIINDVFSSNLQLWAEKVYEKNENLDIILSLAKVLPAEKRSVFYSMSKTVTEGKMPLQAIPLLTKSEQEAFFSALAEYPDFSRYISNLLKTYVEQLDRIIHARAKPEPKKGRSLQDVKALFTPALQELLRFEENEDHIKLKAKKYLRSENFAKIASIVRANKGQYVSGKGSHFRIPKGRIRHEWQKD